MTNVPFGVLLFRGLDSSLVVAMASRHCNNIEATNVWGSQLHIFSIDLKVIIGFD
jgi:asparagine synthetase B (glutamine-hydrolysing)